MKTRSNQTAAFAGVLAAVLLACILVFLFSPAPRHVEAVVLNIPGSPQAFTEVRNVEKSGARVDFELPSGQRLHYEGSYTLIYSQK